MPKTIQIVVEPEIARAIRLAAKRERLSISNFAGRLLLEGMTQAGIVISPAIPKEQLPLIEADNVE